jgi:protein-tyrosine phosphatase
MIDIHSHVLPGIDDGAAELAESLDILRLAGERGTQIIVATPHHKPGTYANPRDHILERVEDLQKKIDLAGIAIKIVPGCEIFADSGLPEKIASRAVLTYGDAGKHILLEFSFQQYPVNVDDMIFRLRIAGITPVIAHPERIRYFQEDIDRLEALVRRGALAQLTAASLTGGFGSRVREISEEMVRRRCIHLLASDCHNLSGRAPGLRTGLARLEALVGSEEAGRMVHEIPAALIEGRDVRVPEPLRAEDLPQKGGLRNFLGRFGLGRSHAD